jgi:hypothetical protein
MTLALFRLYNNFVIQNSSISRLSGLLVSSPYQHGGSIKLNYGVAINIMNSMGRLHVVGLNSYTFSFTSDSK